MRVLACLGAVAALAFPAAAPAARPHLSPAQTKAIRAVLTRYIPAALERRDLRLAYELSGPQVRGGMTLRQWLHGGIPVYPFSWRGDPIEGWVTKWNDGDDVGIDLLLQPRKGTGIGPITFGVEMTKLHGRWLVNAFVPQAIFSQAGKSPSVFSQADLAPQGGGAAADKGRLSPLWFAVPIGTVVGLLLLAPLVAFGLARRRDRRAYRDWLEGRA